MFEQPKEHKDAESLEKEMAEARQDLSRKVVETAEFAIETDKKGLWQRLRNAPRGIANQANQIAAIGKLDRLEEQTIEARKDTPEGRRLKDTVRAKEIELQMAREALEDYLKKGTLTHD